MTTGQIIRQRLLWMLVLGLCLLSIGLYLLWFTPLRHSGNPSELAVAVILIALGLLLLIPAKLYLILQLTRQRRERNKN